MYTAHPQALTEPRSPQHHVQDEDSAVHYILLSAPWAVLCYYAEDLRLKLPLQVPGVHDMQGRPGGPPKPGLLMTAPHVLGALSIADNLRLPILSSKVPRSCHHTVLQEALLGRQGGAVRPHNHGCSGRVGRRGQCVQQPWPSLTTWARQLPTPPRLPTEDHCRRGRGSLGHSVERQRATSGRCAWGLLCHLLWLPLTIVAFGRQRDT